MPAENPSARRLILGLGNPGEAFLGSRHNRGREVVEELVRRRGVELDERLCGALLAGDSNVDLAIPETFMNRSGYAARCLAETRDLAPENMLVVFDDVALPLGSLRLRAQGGPGGQRGMASVIESLRTQQIARLRLGIAPAEGLDGVSDLTDFVLGPFGAEEAETASEQIQRASDACEVWLEEGVEAAMSRFNSTPTSS